MVKYVGYVFIFLLLLLLAMFFKIVICVEKRTVKKYFEKEKEKIEITSILFKKKKIYRNMIQKIKNYSQVVMYLSQADYILSKGAYDFEDIKITTLDDRQITQEVFDKNKFFEEVALVNQNVRFELLELSNILGRIYSLEHPIKFRFITFKKTLKMQILSWQSNILELLEKYFDKFDKKNNSSKNGDYSSMSFIEEYA